MEKDIQDKKLKRKRKPIHVILDLDETLINTATPDEIKSYAMSPAKTKHFKKHDMDGYYIVFERPHLQEFLDWLFQNFKVSVWTAATKEYALFIVDKIILSKPERKLEYVFFSYHCSMSKKLGKGTKDLSLLWDKYKIEGFASPYTVIIDDYKDHVHKIQPDRCIIAVPFDVHNENSEDDEYLKRLQKEMECLSSGKCEDVTVHTPTINMNLSS